MKRLHKKLNKLLAMMESNKMSFSFSKYQPHFNVVAKGTKLIFNHMVNVQFLDLL